MRTVLLYHCNSSIMNKHNKKHVFFWWDLLWNIHNVKSLYVVIINDIMVMHQQSTWCSIIRGLHTEIFNNHWVPLRPFSSFRSSSSVYLCTILKQKFNILVIGCLHQISDIKQLLHFYILYIQKYYSQSRICYKIRYLSCYAYCINCVQRKIYRGTLNMSIWRLRI